MRRVGRRQFLAGGIAGLAVAAFTRVAGAATRLVRPAASPEGLIERYFEDSDGTRRIGRAYLDLVPAEDAIDPLLAALAPEGEDPSEWWGAVTLGELRKEMRRRAHADFESGDVVDLAGWQLARTEARLAALWVITQG